MLLASGQVRDKAVRIAAHLLEAAPDDIDITGQRATPSRAPRTARRPSARSPARRTAATCPQGDEPGLEATRFFTAPGETFPFGVHIAVVDIDKETGRTTLRRFIAVDDCGTVVNPLLLDGQRHGGIAQGAAQALCEEVVYDEDGQLITSTFGDYAIPTAHSLPMFELDRTETTLAAQPARRQGHRRGRHDRQHAGRPERRAGRPAAGRRHQLRHAGLVAEGLARAPGGRRVGTRVLGFGSRERSPKPETQHPEPSYQSAMRAENSSATSSVKPGMTSSRSTAPASTRTIGSASGRKMATSRSTGSA